MNQIRLLYIYFLCERVNTVQSIFGPSIIFSCSFSVSMIANFSGQRLETLKINFLSDVTEQSLIKLAKHCKRLKSVHMYGCPSVRNMSNIQEERPTFTINM